jgi:hypothetical protein
MKTFKSTIETFVADVITRSEMNFLIGGGEPVDMTIPPDGWEEEK